MSPEQLSLVQGMEDRTHDKQILDIQEYIVISIDGVEVGGLVRTNSSKPTSKLNRK